jgi:glutathione S-transferase
LNKIRIFSYLPNPRVWKSIITAKIGGIDLEIIGDKPNNMPNWLWDFDAKPISVEDKSKLKSFEIKSKRGFKGSLYKTDDFIEQHPFGTVPAGFIGEARIGVFESNSILRAVARECKDKSLYGGDDSNLTSRIDSFLDANLVFSREFQVYLLELEDITNYTYERTKASYEFYLDGLEKSLSLSSFIAGDQLTIADISFVCEFAQFLREGHYLEQLEIKNLTLISKNFQSDYPLTFQHFKALSSKEEFSDVMGSYLDWYKM